MVRFSHGTVCNEAADGKEEIIKMLELHVERFSKILKGGRKK